MDSRCVHLDFHTSDEIKGVGENFSNEEFKKTLVNCKLNSITVFAKCHHGNFYYYSDKFHTHPNLARPILDEQLLACKEADVAAKIYLSAGFDEFVATSHPEWLVRDEKGNIQNPFTPFFKRICFNNPYLDLLCEQTKEVVEKYMPDGIFLDIIAEEPCCCVNCTRDMDAKGLDYRNHEDVMNQAREVLHVFYDRIISTAKAIKPDILISFNSGNFPVGRHDMLEACSQIEVESLPTGGWGYDHFPMSMSYLRRVGKNCIGMTGKFHKTWGEFGGYKYKEALLFEAAQCLAFNAGINVGDQLHPTGIIDAYTYEIIASAMSYYKEREEWLGGDYVAELAILSQDTVVGSGKDGDSGLTRMLLEGKYLFDIIDNDEIDNRYKLIILPDNITLNYSTAKLLQEYVSNGGKVIASGKSALYNEEFAIDLGAKFLGKDNYNPTYFRSKYELECASKMPMAVYSQSYDIECTGTILADKISPYYKREGRHFCSHINIPCDYDKVSAGITEGKDGIYIATEIFADYSQVGSLNSKQLVLPLIKRVLGDKRIQINSPSSSKVTLYKKEQSYIFHIIYANIISRGSGTEVIEDIIPLNNIKVSIILDENIKEVIRRPSGAHLDFYKEKGIVNFNIDTMFCSEIIELQF